MKKRYLAVFTVLILMLSFISPAASLPVTAARAPSAKLTDKQACSRVFDYGYYAQRYPDVVAARGNSSAALLDHYFECGLAEGRNASATFNATAYKNRYSDLSDAYGDDMIKYVRHYITYGISEGRDASPAPAGSPGSGKIGSSSNSVDAQFLGSYTTRYNPNIDRANNVVLSSSRINGFVVAPGTEFSFSNTILPRTIANGYVEAPVFIDRQVSRGIGGGICQVSSTLYASMLTAGLPATERHAHSLPVTYIPSGWDATVSDTSLDLKFVNIYERPLMITSSAENGVLTVSLYLV